MGDACGEIRQIQLQTPQRWGGKVGGPLLTAVFAGALFWLRTVDINVPNPVLFFANGIVLSAFFGGVWSGLASVAITFAFAIFYWSVPGQLLHYAAVDWERLFVLALTMPPLGLLVGLLRRAYDRKQQELVNQNRSLAAELQRVKTLEAMQRDVEHIMRHDLRTPLNGIINIPQMLLDDDNLTTPQQEMLAMVATAGRNMLSQINNSLELRRIEDGSYTPNIQPCDPARVLQETFNILAINAHGTKDSFRLKQQAPVTLNTDCRILAVIVANLLRNALEASDEDSPVVVELGEAQGVCVITIANNRPVPEDIRQRFFEKYATSGKSGGTGLGTYSALIMTTALGGSLAMETSETEGTKVTLRIPLENK